MILKDLIALAKKIIKVNPEAANAVVKACNQNGDISYPEYIAYDTKHKHRTIWLEE